MKFFSRIRPTALWLVTLSVLFVAQTALFGQATGNVTGIVEDESGAVIPKATIVLTNLVNGGEITTTSNASGAFAFAGLVPATYSFKVTVAGFDSWQTQPFAVHSGDQLSFTDIRMKVGAAATEVTVEAKTETGIANLDTAEQSEIINAEELNTLSIVGRDATELVRMLPGYAMSTGDQGLFNRPGYNSAVVGLSGPTGAFSANGAGVTGIATVTDGVSLTDIATNSGSVQQINIEMVNSVKASNSTYGAVYAKGPAVISAESKQGGSKYHGELYLAARNTDLNSNDWYDNYLRQSRPAGSYYYPGGQIGGPLPFFGHANPRLFFFAGFEYFNQSFEANQQAISAWVPTMAERQGDFSPSSLDAELCGTRPDGTANPNAIQAMCNSDNYLPNGTAVTNYNAQPFVNTSGAALVNWFPEPNADPFTNPFGYNFIQQVIENQNGEQFKATLNYNIDDRQRLFLVYGLQKEIDQDPVALNQSFPSGSMPYPGGVTTGDVSNVLSGHYSRTFGSSIDNELSVAMSFVSLPGKMGNPQAVDRYDMSYYNCNNPSLRNAGACPYTVGNNFNYLGMYKNSGDLSVPAVGGFNGLGYPNLSMPGGFYNNQIHTKKVDPVVQDDLSWQLGNHFLQFGAYGETGTYNGIADAGAYPQGQMTDNPVNGYFEYSSTNGPPYTGCQNPSTMGNLRPSGANYLGSCYNPTAMMYEGYADSWTQTNFTPLVDMRYLTAAGYVNDTWRLHRLTMILGARIEHLGPWVDRHNNGLATFSDSLYNTQCGGYTRDCSSANMPGITWSSQKSGVSNSVNTPPMIYFTPRVGASWDLFGKGKTVIRGGWGIYRNEEQFNPYALASATAQGYKTSQLIGALTFNQIDSESPLNPPDFNAYTLSPSDTNRPIYYQYSGSIDERMPWNSLAQIAVVGSHNVNLGSYNGSSYNEASDINIICGIEKGCPQNNNPYMAGATPADSLYQVNLGNTNPDWLAMVAVQNPQCGGCGIGDMDTSEYDFFRPYPFYQHVYTLKHNFYSNYNSVQAQWNKQAGMVTFGANYTFAKNLATAASWNNQIVDPVNLRNDYNPVPYDRSQTFNVHYLVNIGQRLYKGSAWWLSEIVNGWQVSGISTVSSGFPIASENGQNFGFGYGGIQPVGVQYQNQSFPSQGQNQNCQYVWKVPPNGQGNYYCTTSMNPTVWLGSPDLQLMPKVLGNPRGGPQAHQFINPLAFGLPAPGSNGTYRMPYIHGPAYMDHDITLLKNFSVREGQNLQLRMAAFNVFNHPLVSFNNQNTNNLTLSFNQATVGQALTNNVLIYPDFGVANIKVGNRLVEVEAKYSF
jgi:hypothetical protein